MNKREDMKVENLVRNYKMDYSDRQDEEEIKVGQDEPLFKVTLNKPIPKKELLSSATLAFAWLDRQTDFREDFLYGKGCVRIME